MKGLFKGEGYYAWLCVPQGSLSLIHVQVKDIIRLCGPTRSLAYASKDGHGCIPLEELTPVTEMEKEIILSQPYSNWSILLRDTDLREIPSDVELLDRYCENALWEKGKAEKQVMALQKKLATCTGCLRDLFVTDRDSMFIQGGESSPQIKLSASIKRRVESIFEGLAQDIPKETDYFGN